ncbi:MAG: hypothetical protein CVU43_05990 [Chloroflexi bacterium HGW-Chloroflexi-5]|jgi:hypothetical protein|nr:MAG: hypothetical protein CVU43_05990 [Chloroflexi bacterium HGW-Chloroflexi-5]
MDFIITVFLKALSQLGTSLLHNWPYLLISIVVAVGLKVVMDPKKAYEFLLKHNKVGVLGAVAVAVTTPFCSCGTTAVLLGMMATTMPWAPIIAFMVASPLTSPQEFVYSAGLFGWPFAIAFFVSSIVLGLAGGLIGDFLDRKKWLKNQSRFEESAPKKISRKISAAAPPCGCTPQPSYIINRPVSVGNNTSCCGPSVMVHAPMPAPYTCGSTAAVAQTTPSPCGCGSTTTDAEPKSLTLKEQFTWQAVSKAFMSTAPKLLLMFVGFAFIGFFLNGLIQTAWITALFGSGNIYSVPLAAILGLPFYINTEGSLPLVRALIDGGMSQGAALAFMVTGSGTSIGAVMGALAIARWKVIVVVIATLWVGSIILGYGYNFVLAAGLF